MDQENHALVFWTENEEGEPEIFCLFESDHELSTEEWQDERHKLEQKVDAACAMLKKMSKLTELIKEFRKQESKCLALKDQWYMVLFALKLLQVHDSSSTAEYLEERQLEAVRAFLAEYRREMHSIVEASKPYQRKE